ncbi:class I SAM-dependent methyltransferase [bacterium]|nr:class I SAM-dependent methyltransferase [bacterium]
METQLDQHFEFGKNWQRFLVGVSEEKLEAAAFDIKEFLGGDGVAGKSFIDIGCGSGLSSLAAWKLGAKTIYSYDIDPINIQNVEFLKQHFQVPATFPWVAEIRSIVEIQDVSQMDEADIVYSWGVLHHTGDLWHALKNASSLVNRGGVLYLMLYRDARLAYPWKIVKRTYIRSPRWVQFIMRNLFAGIQIAGILAKGKNPKNSIKNYGKRSRGMSWYTDVTDWIGGYPFEYTKAEDVIEFLKPLGFELVRIRPEISKKSWGVFGTGSYQYLFKKLKKENY